MKYYTWIFIIFSFLTVNCQSVKSFDKIPDADVLFSYERTPCFGWCPVYQVKVLKNGQVFFMGKQYVPFLDSTQVNLPDNTFNQVKSILEHPDYLNIVIEVPDYHITDIPGLKFRDYEGDRAYELDMVTPDAIRVLTDKIDQVLIARNLLYDKEKLPMIRKEILVELHPNIDPYSLEGKDSFYQLSYRDHVGEQIYVYELICAEKRIKDALSAIKRRKEVRETQLNHKLERR